MGLTKDEVNKALTQHMQNPDAPRQERKEATELRLWVHKLSVDAEELQELDDDLRGLTDNTFWDVQALHKKGKHSCTWSPCVMLLAYTART